MSLNTLILSRCSFGSVSLLLYWVFPKGNLNVLVNGDSWFEISRFPNCLIFKQSN